ILFKLIDKCSSITSYSLIYALRLKKPYEILIKILEKCPSTNKNTLKLAFDCDLPDRGIKKIIDKCPSKNAISFMIETKKLHYFEYTLDLSQNLPSSLFYEAFKARIPEHLMLKLIQKMKCSSLNDYLAVFSYYRSLS